jgi:membrane associated rhomboid family serine protease
MSNIHGINGFRDQTPARPQSQYAAPEQDEFVGIPFSPPPEHGMVSSVREKIMPRFNKKTFCWFIICVNTVMLLVEFIVGEVVFPKSKCSRGGGAMVKGNQMGGPSPVTLQYCGGKSTGLIQKGQIWRLITPVFLHGGLLHLVMNTLFTLQLGFTLELRWGIRRFIAVYFVAGLGGNLLSALAFWHSISVGASSALFGLFGANITYLIMNWIDIPGNSQEMCCMVFMVVLNFLYGAADSKSSVDWAAHLGGLLSGLFTGAFLTPVMHPTLKTPMYKIGGSILTAVYFLTTFLLLFFYVEGGEPESC